MKIAYFSPFPPEASGIADFSHELVEAFLNNPGIEVDLFYPGNLKDPGLFGKVKVYELSDFDDDNVRARYDHFVYHVGNNTKYHKWVVETFKKYPGILELHDLSLHYYLAEDTWADGKPDEYVRIMKYCHGVKGERAALQFNNAQIRAPWETSSDIFTVNKHLVDIASAVIVHSDFAKQTIKGIRPDVDIINIPLHTSDIIGDYHNYKQECREKLGIEQLDLVMGVFGYATTAKRIQQVVEALHLYHKKSGRMGRNLFLYIVGKLEDKQVIKLIKQYDLEKVVIVKGFVTLDEFKICMGACDFCFNLRYPSQGESSASLHRMLGMGKPVVITKIASFEQYPDDIVVKISHGESEVEEIYHSICLLADNNGELRNREESAYRYAIENCSIELNVQKYIGFFSDLSAGQFQESYLDSLVDRLISLGLDNEEYVVHMVNQLDTRDYVAAT